MSFKISFTTLLLLFDLHHGATRVSLTGLRSASTPYRQRPCGNVIGHCPCHQWLLQSICDNVYNSIAGAESAVPINSTTRLPLASASRQSCPSHSLTNNCIQSPWPPPPPPPPWPPPWRIIEHSMSCQIKEYVMTLPLYCPKMMMSLQATWHDLTQDSFHHSIPLVPDHSQGLHHLKGVNMEQPNWLLQRKPILYLLLFF